METCGGNLLPVHSVVIRDIYTGSAAAEDDIAANIFYASLVAMGGSGGSYPGGAAIIREITILFLRGVSCKITSYDDQLPAAFQLVMIFNGDRIGAGHRSRK